MLPEPKDPEQFLEKNNRSRNYDFLSSIKSEKPTSDIQFTKSSTEDFVLTIKK